MDQGRKKLAVIIFLIGVLVTVIYRPLNRCYGLGDNGEMTERSYCRSEGYHFLFGGPKLSRGMNWEMRINHKLMAIQWGVLAIVCVLIGMNYGWLIGNATEENDEGGDS